MGVRDEGKIPLISDNDYNSETKGERNLHKSTSVAFNHDLTSLPTTEIRNSPQQSLCLWLIEILLKIVLSAGILCGLFLVSSMLWTHVCVTKPITIVYQEIYLQEPHIVQQSLPYTHSAGPMCDIADPTHKFDCHPGPNVSQSSCEAKGCCWKVWSAKISVGYGNVPYCYFPSNYPGYEVTDMKPTSSGYTASLHSTSSANDWPGSIQDLVLDISLETSSRLHFTITDSQNSRYRVPINTPKAGPKDGNPDYVFEVKKQPFGIVVKRRKTNTTIFDTTIAPMVYADQFIQVSTQIPSGFVYGLGEHRGAFIHNVTEWQQLSLWARDVIPGPGMNLYGVHPFFMSIEKDGSAYGVFLLNSNAMDVAMQPYPALTYRTIGGILDFYIFTGPTPVDVIRQYTAVIGHPALPPYWSLGYHLCRWGYGGTAGLQKVIHRMRNASFPYDTQWVDIDYMNNHLVWTYDQQNYAGLPDIVKDLHDHDQHFVIILDPGISNQHAGKYLAYDDGLKRDVYVKDFKNTPIEGSVWPGKTVFPDFSNPEADDWWYDCAKTLHQQIPFDGLWNDMNEPSNFAKGSTSGCSNSSLDNPPYTPGILGGMLQDQTLCPSAKHHLGSHYNLHSLYGHMEARASHRALEKLRGKRALVIARSTFPSSGLWGGHWSGDNHADWDNLYYSIPEILSFQMFGIPFVGADVCGFSGNTTDELCTRWMQLAVFYPFMRNHNYISSPDQDPAVFSSITQGRLKDSLILRYTLIPYLYTLLYNSHTQGTPVANHLSFMYPADSTTYNVDKQLMWGNSLLISPVLKQGDTNVTAYIPKDTWYDMFVGSRLEQSGVWATLDAPIDRINVHIRGGSIIPLQPPLLETTTAKARKNPFALLVALDLNGAAQGDLFWDDGDTINSTGHGEYSFITFNAAAGQISSNITHMGYKPATGMMLGDITVMGIAQQPETVLVNSSAVQFSWNSSTKVLNVQSIRVNLLQAFKIQWTS